MGYSAQYGLPCWVVMPMILLYIYIMDAVAGFLGLATVLIPYTYWIHQKIKNKTKRAACMHFWTPKKAF